MNNILIFGEILYDIYDDVAVIGGAPFNYSVQLSRLISKNDNLKFITAFRKRTIFQKTHLNLLKMKI